MNKPKSVAYIVFCTILVIVLIVALVIFGNVAEDKKYKNYSDVSHGAFELTPEADSRIDLSTTATKFDISIAFGEVTISSTTDAPYATFSNTEFIRVTNEDQGDTYKLRVRHRGNWGIFSGNGWRNDNIPRVDIYLPAAKLAELDLDVSAGTIDMSSISANSIEIDVSAGTVLVYDIAADSLDTQVSAGELTIKDSFITKFDGDVSAGDLTYYADPNTRAISVDVTAGAATVKLPETIPGMRIKYRSTVGGINDNTNFNLPTFDDGVNKSGTMTYGDSSVMVDLEVTAGDITLDSYS